MDKDTLEGEVGAEEVVQSTSVETDKQKVAALLIKWMRSAGLNDRQLSAELGYAKERIKSYLNLTDSFPPAKLGDLLRICNPPVAEAEAFAGYVVKNGLIPENDPEWLRRKIEAKQWEFISYPSLDPAWLKHQPAHLRAGHVIRDLISKNNSSDEAIDGLMNSGVRSTLLWKSGKRDITDSQASELAEIIGSTDSEKSYLMSVIQNEENRKAVKANIIQYQEMVRERKKQRGGKDKGGNEPQKVLPVINTSILTDTQLTLYNHLTSRCQQLNSEYTSISGKNRFSWGDISKPWTDDEIREVRASMMAITRVLHALKSSHQEMLFTWEMCRNLTSLDENHEMPLELITTYLDLLNAAVTTNSKIITPDYLEPFARLQEIALQQRHPADIRSKANSYIDQCLDLLGEEMREVVQARLGEIRNQRNAIMP